MKSQAEEKVNQLRELLKLDDIEAIKKASDDLGDFVQQLGASMYQQPQEGPQPDAGSEAGSASGDQSTPDDEDVVDGDFKSE